MGAISIAEPASMRERESVSAERLPAVYHDPEASDWSVSRAKRAIDIFVASLILLIAGVPMLLIGICVRLTSPGKAIFVQERVGARGRLFRLYKFRTMFTRRSTGVGLTREGDSRVTPVGRILRKLKLDELPQFYNVLRGDMSLVGPRPKLPRYAALINMPYRPGITGWATLHFSKEESLLQSYTDPAEMEKYYRDVIKPAKARLDYLYMSSATLGTDLTLLFFTALACTGWWHCQSAFDALAKCDHPKVLAGLELLKRSAY
jgi:lipopolysaccharide/colanic/teichoic acid biosynthesis glycosyltransferase